MKKMWIFVLTITFISGIVADQALAADVANVTVSSKVAWTDTGLDVQAGDLISITASGTVIFDSAGESATPDGRPDRGNGCGCNHLVFCAVPQSLVGWIGDASSLTEPGGFFVGSVFDGVASTSGKLFLGFNDGFVKCDRSGLDVGGVGDNSGSFTAEVEIRSCRKILCR